MALKKSLDAFLKMLETSIIDRSVVTMETMGASCDSLKFTFIVPEDDLRAILKHCRNHGYQVIQPALGSMPSSLKTQVFVNIASVFSAATQPKRIMPVRTQSQARQKGLSAFFASKIMPDNTGVK